MINKKLLREFGSCFMSCEGCLCQCHSLTASQANISSVTRPPLLVQAKLLRYSAALKHFELLRRVNVGPIFELTTPTKPKRYELGWTLCMKKILEKLYFFRFHFFQFSFKFVLNGAGRYVGKKLAKSLGVLEGVTPKTAGRP